MRRIALVLAATLALVVTAAACGVPRSGDFQRINPDDVPAVLSESTSTTAPSTTRPPFTTPTTATVSTTSTSTSTTIATTTTSTAAYDVQIYFVAGPDQLTAITRQLASPAPGQVLSALVEGVPEGTEYQGLGTALPPGLDWNVSVTGGRATVDLPPEFATVTPTRDQLLAIAQIVLTLTSRPGVGQVTFESNDQPIRVTKGDGQLTTVGADVVCEDYLNVASGASCG